MLKYKKILLLLISCVLLCACDNNTANNAIISENKANIQDYLSYAQNIYIQNEAAFEKAIRIGDLSSLPFVQTDELTEIIMEGEDNEDFKIESYYISYDWANYLIHYYFYCKNSLDVGYMYEIALYHKNMDAQPKLAYAGRYKEFKETEIEPINDLDKGDVVENGYIMPSGMIDAQENPSYTFAYEREPETSTVIETMTEEINGYIMPSGMIDIQEITSAITDTTTEIVLETEDSYAETTNAEDLWTNKTMSEAIE